MSDELRKEALEFLTKWYLWLCYVLVGVIAHISNMVLMNKRRTLAQAIASVCLAGFVGYLAAVYCITYCPEQGKFIVPIATLSSEKVVNGLMSIDWRGIIETVFKTKSNDEQ
jgi:hypothetical protein